MAGRAVGSCCRSASITARYSPRAIDMPSSTAADRPLSWKRRMTRTEGSVRAISSATRQVPSGLSSSATTISWSMPSRAAWSSSTRIGRFSDSLKVGVTTDSSGVVAGASPRSSMAPARYRPLSQRPRTLIAVCGRFVSSSPPDEIARYFDVDEASAQALEHRANFNTAPTTDVFVVYRDGATRRLDTFHWGLVPRWAKDLSLGNRLINARAESVATKPAFRHAF